MRIEMVSILRIFMMALAFVMVSVPAQFGVNSAHAGKNYLKISKAMIGRSMNVSVGLNKSMVIDLPGDAHDILVADPEVADEIGRAHV